MHVICTTRKVGGVSGEFYRVKDIIGKVILIVYVCNQVQRVIFSTHLQVDCTECLCRWQTRCYTTQLSLIEQVINILNTFHESKVLKLYILYCYIDCDRLRKFACFLRSIVQISKGVPRVKYTFDHKSYLHFDA